MNDKHIISQFAGSSHQNNDKDGQQKFEITLSLTRDQISTILDDRLGEKIEHNSDHIEDLLSIAECIKSTRLSEQFCNFFMAELEPLLNETISGNTDSYLMTNFQHRMLRKFANCAVSKKTA